MGFRIPTYSNPADYYMRALKINYPKKESDHEKLKILTDTYERELKSKIESDQSLVTIEEKLEMDGNARSSSFGV